MKILDIINKMESFAPLSISEEAITRGHKDNSGLLVGSKNKKLKGVVICIDVTKEAVDFACEKGANLIISHHPFIYYPLYNLSDEDYKGVVVDKLFKNDIAVYSSHLCMDMCENGVDDTVAKLLGIRVFDAMDKLSSASYGKLGKVEKVAFDDYIKKVKNTFEVVQASRKARDEKIEKVASFCGGGLSSDGVQFCKKMEVDVVISCDIPHHILLELASLDIKVIMLSHGESEFKAFKMIFENLLKDTENVFYFEEDYRLN